MRILGMPIEAFNQLLEGLLTKVGGGALSRKPEQERGGGLRFGLAFSGASGSQELILDLARAADRAGLTSLWLPERHFQPLAGLSPNPSVLAAALARETERIALRAGSVALSLHHPVRVVEEWALVDNLSGGRVGLSFAAGGHPDDFILASANSGHHVDLSERVATLRRLWRGETVRLRDGAGSEVDLRVYPLPAQRDLPVWISTGDDPDLFRLAGEMAAGILTHLLGQTIEELAAHLEIYRAALDRAGHLPEAGHVTLLLPTFLDADAESAVAAAQQPLAELLEARTPVLIGSCESVAPFAERLREIGVDEIACLVDFGVEAKRVRASLPWIAELQRRFRAPRRRPSGEAPRRFPLTEAQRDLWTVAQLGEDASLAYLEAGLIEVRGPLDPDLLRRSLQEGVDRHEALRSFLPAPPAGEEPFQEVLPELDLDVPFVDLSALPPGRREEAVHGWAEQESRRRFDLSRAPLFRATLARLAPEVWRLGLFGHHIVVDGLSIAILLTETLAIYEAGRAGRRAALPEPLQFREYAAWLAAGGAESPEDEAFWLAEISKPLPVFEPPADRPRPPVRTFRGARRRRILDPALDRGLRQTARQQRATPFIGLLAAWTALLHRWTGQDDLIVGGPSARRPLEGGDRLVGHCVDLVPYRSRTDGPGEPAFTEHLAALRRFVFASHEHGYPLARLLRRLELPHDPSRVPLINAVFNMDPGLEITHAAGLGLAEISPVITHAKYDVAVHVLEAGGKLVLYLDYRCDLFDPATMDRLLDHLETLIGGVNADPSQALGDLPLLSAAERSQILVEWNRTESGSPLDTPVHDLFDAVAERTPEAPAVIWSGPKGEEESLTYRELRHRADSLALHLRGMGIGPEVPVVLEMERSPDLVVALLAVLKAGGFYVPLDPSDPEERQAFVLEDTGAAVRVGGEEIGQIRPIGPIGPIRPLQSPDVLAYTLYTSGSTGKPKGVAVPHRAVVRLALADYVRLTPADRVGHLSNTAFDAATFEIWGALLNGAALVVIPREVAVVPAALGAEIRRRGVTAAFFTVALFNEVVREAPEALAGMRWVLAGGEAVSADRMREALAATAANTAAGTETRFLNGYGPTESTTFALTHWITAAPPGRSIPIGRPISDTRAYIVDRLLRPVPAGTPGELCLGGAGLARGYFRRPELTAERFVPDPFAPEDRGGERLYRTGDLARFQPEGTVEYLGRTDAQVKIRGFRVEPGEIEAALEDHPAVREAAVVAQEASGGRRLAAFLVPEEGADLGDAVLHELLQALRERLPHWMVPSAVSVLEALPKTPSGKIDRRALAQEVAQGAPEAPFEAPRTPIEELVAAAWAEVLERERIGLHDDFFALGGHSLLATQVISRLRVSCGVELPLRRFFAQPRLVEMAEGIEEMLRGGEPSPPAPLPRAGEGRELPLSFAQERLWFLDRLVPGSPAYNIPALCRIAGPLSPAVLGRALREVERRHEVLRTTFAAGAAGLPRQVIAPEPRLRLPLVDLGGLPSALRPAEEERLAAIEAARPFDLAAEPLARALLLRSAPDDHALFLNLHHIAADGWSLGVLARELSALYTAFAQGEPSPLPDLPVQYADFAVWQRRWLSGPVLDEQLAWWRGHLAEAPAQLDLPTDRPRPAIASQAGAQVSAELPAALVSGTETLARREGVTPFMVWLAACATLLSRWTGQDDLVIGTPVANRNRAETEGLIGFFVNTLPLRVRLAGQPSFRELLVRVREAALGAFTHQDVPLEKLIEELHPERDPSRNPLVEVLFSLLFVPPPPTSGLALGPWRFVAPGTAKFDLAFELEAEEEVIHCEHRTSLFDRATIQRLLQGFVTLLAGALAAPEAEAAGLPLLSPAEEAQLAAWSRTPGPEAEGELVPQLVLAAAARTPDSIALAAGENVWTYGAMAAAVLRLADHLREQGVGPETRVALFFERSPELVVAALGVLCAGGAYLPLDPEAPPERIALIVEDAGAGLVLTREALTGLPFPPLPLAGEGPGVRALAYLIYTSGSTGRPKGVEVPHAGLLNLVRWHLATYELTAADHACVLAAPSFDASVWEIWPALCAGASLHFTPADARLDPPSLVEWLAAEEVTIGFLPTPLAEAVLDEPWPAGTALRFLLTGGDRLGRRPAPHLPFVLVNHYGPTESSVIATAAPVPPHGEGAPSIGRPIAGLSLWILDRSLRPVPVGAAGEICLGGTGVARGYAGRPDWTAERFTPALSGEPGGRLYRTGDLARWRPDGTVEFLGRVDFQVKIRGFRIELGEIEAALTRQPEVREAVVLARPGAGGDPRLVAWVVGVDGPPPPADELRRRLAHSLPSYMIPSAFVELDRLPLTPHGKVDRRALPEPREAESGPAVPRGEIQEMLASVWADLLGVEHLGPQSDFFALGGHSLLATQVISRLRAACGVELPLRRFFAQPKLGDLAIAVEEALRGEPSPPAPLPQAGEGSRMEEIPLSFAQQRLWFLDGFAPGTPVYNIPAVHRIAGPLSVPDLEGALQEIVRRHEVLRTTFSEGASGMPRQVIASAPLVPLPVVDLGGLPPEPRQAEDERLTAAEATRPFDLETGPLLRALLLRASADDHALVLNLHHIVADGWSIHLLMRELDALYAAFASGAPSPLPDLPVQYADFALWQHRWLTGPVLDEQLSWWRRHLADAPAEIDLPTDRPRPAVVDPAGANAELSLPAELAAGARSLARREAATPFMVWLTALAALLSRWTGQDDLVLGTPVANRNRAETEGLIGFFVNTLPLRIHLTDRPKFRELLARVRDASLGAFTHQDVPLEKLIEELHPERDPSRTPLVEVLFSLQLAPPPAGLGAWRFVPTGTAKFDLTFEIEEGAVRCEYRTALFDPATIDRLLHGLLTLLAGALEEPEATVAGLPLPDGLPERIAPPVSLRRLRNVTGEAGPAREERFRTSPRTPTEESLAALWRELLGVAEPSREDSFFALGGHSLLAARCLARVRQSFGVRLPIRTLFEHPTLEGLAARLDEALGGAGAAEAPPLVPVPRDEPSLELPLSFPQQRLWFLDRFAPGSPIYNIPALCRIAGPLSVPSLESALHEVSRRHEILRTTFTEGSSGTPRQVIAPGPLLPLPAVDLGGLPPEARHAETGRLGRAEALRPFNLETGPLLRALLLRTAADDSLLALNLHHIVADGWSIHLLMRELGALYTAFSTGAPSPLPDLPVQYADFAVWQHRWLTGAVLDEQLSWWRRHLAEAPARLDLPTDRPRPAMIDLAGAHASEDLPAELAAGVQALAHREGATPFMVWLAAFAALLSRWTGQDDLVIGTPVANRNRAETEGLIGFFVNTLPLRAGLAGLSSFRDLLARVRETALGGFTHQDVPLEKLVEELHPERDPSRTPLVETLFSLQLAPPDRPDHPELGSWRFMTTGTAKFDLTIEVEESVGCEYRTSLFDPTTIQRLLKGLVTLLTGAVAAPETEAAGLPLFSAAERHQILVEWISAESGSPLDTPVDVLFDAVAERDPAAPAVIWSGPEGKEESLTYADLRGRAESLALHLRGLGVGPEVPVLLELERSAELIVAMLAVLKAGGFYVPVDSSDPEERRAFVAEDAGAVVRLGGEEIGQIRPIGPIRPITASSAGGQGLAYTIYTSGSSGRPKGVMIPHQGVVRLALADYIRLAPDDRVGQLSNTAFDVATFEIWGALLNGAAVVMIPRGVLLEPAALAAEIRRRRVTAGFFTVSLFSEMVREAPEVLLGMRWVLAGGEAVPPEAMRGILAARAAGAAAEPETRFLNGYGPTECTAFALTHRVTAAPLGRSIPIGRPISDTRACVLDRRLRPAPLGTPGELCLGDEGLARGYFGRPDLTAERFIPDPFAREGRGGERLYRTGDLARFLPDGTVEYLGRTDAQVKIRGFRVEPGEIEAVLAGHPAVREAAVVAQEGSAGRRLAAFLVADEGADLGETARHDLLRWLRERLPQWMVPASVSVVEALPKTPSGKIDRRALTLREAQGAPEAPFEAPRTPLEELVAAVWAEVLQRERVGLRDDFFALGGHSLLAARVISRLRASCGVELPLRRFFARPQLVDLAADIEEALREGPSNPPPSPDRGRGAGGEGSPLSFAQQRLWFVAELAPESPALNIPVPFHLAGPLDVPALERALGAVVRRHEVLRVTIVRRDGALLQAVAPAVPVALPRIDLSALPPETRAAEADRLSREEGKRPFDLEAGPLWRAVLLRLGPEAHRFVPVLHHIVCDGWSVDILERELAVLYEAFAAGRPSPLPPLPLQYPDFALWQRRRLTEEALTPSLDYWRQSLAGLRPLELPADRPRPRQRSGRGTFRARTLPADVAAAAHRLAQGEGATLYMVLLAAFFALLEKATGQSDLAVGSPVAGRDHLEHEGLIGLFVNSLVLRAGLGGDPSFRELLRRVRETTLGAFTHQEVPFERLVEELDPQRGAGRTPLFQVMFALLYEQAGPQTGSGGIEMVRLNEHNDTAQFDLTLYMGESGGTLTAAFEYATDLFTAATIDWMLARFEDLLAAATADPDRRLSTLPPEQWLALQGTAAPEPPAEPESRLQALQNSVEERRSRLSDEARALLARRLRGRSS